jgi:hypothetical protein
MLAIARASACANNLKIHGCDIPDKQEYAPASQHRLLVIIVVSPLTWLSMGARDNSVAGKPNMENRPACSSSRELAVVERPVASLKPWKNNPRTHSKKQIRQIAESLKQFGWTNPVLVDGADGIIAGHGRVEAAKLLGLTSVPTIALSEMSEAERRAYVIADNRLAEQAGWDENLLAIEFQFLVDADDLNFDVEITGFDMGDIDRILGNSIDEEPEQVELPDEEIPAVSRDGDIWTVGRHKIICGNSLEPATYLALLGSEKAAMVFTDPPC